MSSGYLFQVRIHRVPSPIAIIVSEDDSYINNLDCEFISNSINEINFTEEEANLIFKNYKKSQYNKGELISITATKNNTIKLVASYGAR
jgi:hypothetical protein